MPSEKRNTPPLPNLMVTGASGNLGYWICHQAKVSWAVTGIYWKYDFKMDGVRSAQADLTDVDAADYLMGTIRPQAVIHAAAASQPARCETHPEATRRVNVDVPKKLAALCADRKIPFIFTSTDLVFDGHDAPYTELDGVTPVCVYGRQKADAEDAVLKINGKALVCRMPLMIGAGPAASSSFAIQMLRGILSGDPLRLLTDEFRTPVSFVDAAKGLLSLLGKTRGRLHMGGRHRVSRYELGLLMAKQLGIAPTMIQPVTIKSLKLSVPRSPDCSLASDTAYALGYDPAPLSAAVQWTVRQFEENSNG